MANPSVTYTFTNGTVADGTEVNTNFSDLIASLTDGTKSLSIDAITGAGAATFNGNTTLGNAAGDTLTVNATTTYANPVSFDGNVTLGDAVGDTINVKGTADFDEDATFDKAIIVTTDSSFAADVGIGELAPDVQLHLTQNETTTTTQMKIENQSGSSGTGTAIEFAIANSSTANAKMIVERSGTAGTQFLFQNGDTVSTTPITRLKIFPTGEIGIGGSGETRTHQLNTGTATTASPGANADVPSQVVGYITVTLNGSARKIPYYGN